MNIYAVIYFISLQVYFTHQILNSCNLKDCILIIFLKPNTDIYMA